jgi:hypothetical protein
MKPLILAASIAFALSAAGAQAQNATSGLKVMPGINGESGGTVTGAGPGREGLFGSPPVERRDIPADRGVTSSDPAKGAGRGPLMRPPVPDEGHRALGGRKRSSAASGADPR